MTSTAGPAPIASHRLLGDGRATALVLPDGTVDWWCGPEPDDPPLLWHLLDPAGPRCWWEGAVPVGAARPVAGPALRTTVAVDGALVQLLDALVHHDGRVVLGRFVRAVDVDVELTHRTGPGLGGFEATAAARPSWVDGDPGSSARARPEDRVVTVASTGSTRIVDGGATAVVEARSDRWSGVVLALGDGAGEVGEPVLDVEAIAALAERQLRDHDDGIGACGLPTELTEVAIDALAVLIACTAAGTGALVAAPTTSLPEVVGGDRQFDYRYCWLRDSAQAVSVAAQLGHHHAARRLFDFLSDLGPDRLLESPVFTVRGGDLPAERTVPTVAGWRGSQPVRLGNDAAGQIQHDVLGIVVESITAYDEMAGGLRSADLAIVAAFADRALEEPDRTNGIWELREPADLVSADIGCWIALDRAAALAARHRPLRWAGRRRRWTRTAEVVRAKVLDALRPDGGLPRAYDDEDETHDASALLAILYGLLDRDDPRANALFDATIGALGDGPFLRRYCGFDDGFTPGEGAFMPCSWWAVSALAILGRKDEARQRADAIRAVFPGIQPEEVDVEAGTGRGNVPLVWAHTEAARAVILLDRA